MSGLNPEDEDEFVLHGIRTLASSAGTYVVKAKDGLRVQDPSGNFFLGADDCDTNMLQYGDRIQVLKFENMTATLPKGAGFVSVSNYHELVKGKHW